MYGISPYATVAYTSQLNLNIIEVSVAMSLNPSQSIVNFEVDSVTLSLNVSEITTEKFSDSINMSLGVSEEIISKSNWSTVPITPGIWIKKPIL